MINGNNAPISAHALFRTLQVPRGVTSQKVSQVPQGVGAELQPARRPQGGLMAATRIVSVVLAMLLAITMLPAAGLQTAYADEPTAGATEVADNGLMYKVADGAATLIGFEDDAAPEGAVVVPETVGDGATVKAVEIAEGQVAEGVTSLSLPQAMETIKIEGLAAALPALASIEVAGNGGAYSSVAGMLFRSAEGQTSSDGTAFAEDALELVWAPPAMVVARIPLECKAIAAGAFVDASALETVMSFGKMESIAAAEKDDEGNVTKPGAFTDEQISRLTIVVPGTNYAVTAEDAERVSGSVALSEKTDMLEKRKAWFHYGFFTDQIIMGAPFGEIEGVIGVDDEGIAEDRSLITPLQNGKGHLDLTPEEQAEADARKAAEPTDGLSFSYQASMDLSVKWAGDKTATPAHVEIPAYVAIDDVKYQVTAIEPNAFEGAVFLTSVAIPEGVTAIGESAFAGCANLKSVSLPSTLKTIDYAAFKGTALESVNIPEGVRWIGGEAFDEDVEVAGSLSMQEAKAQTLDERDASDSMAYYGVSESTGVLTHINELVWDWTTTNEKYTSGITYVNDTAYTIQTNFYVGSGPSRSLDFNNLPLQNNSPFSGNMGPGGTKGQDDYQTQSGIKATIRNGNQICVGFGLWGGFWAQIWETNANLVNKVSYMGAAIPSYPNYVTVGFDSPERVKLVISDKRDIQFQPNLPSMPAGFVSSVRYAEGTDLTNVNKMTAPSGLRFAGWGLVNPDGTRTYVDQRNADGRLIAPAEATTYFAMWDYDIEYWSRDGSAMLSKETYLLGDPDAKFSSDNGIEAHPGYEARGWSTARSSDVTAGFGLGSDMGTAFDPRSFSMDKSGDSTYKLYAAYTPNRYNIRYEGNGGSWLTDSGEAPTGKQYVFGEGTALSADIAREGYWFMGWTPPKEAAVAGDHTSEAPEVVKSAGTDWYGNVVLTAVWKPKTYALTYDISKAADDSINILPGETKVFAHPSAVGDVQGLSYDEADLTDFRQNNGCIDLSAIGEAHKAEYLDMDLATLSGEPAGYEFHGWVKPDYVAGTSPDGDATWGAGEEGWHAFTKDVVDALWADQDDASTNDPTTNEATVYGVYKALGTTAIELRANGPVGAPDAGTADPDGKQLEWASGSSDALSSQSIFYWPRKGLVDTAAGQTSETGYVDGAGQNLSTWDVNGSTNAAGIDREMLKRYGYRFLGWGVQGATRADDVAYIAYNEDDGQLTLTEAGQRLVKDSWNGGAAVKPVAWDALWEVRTYEITLRLPAPAVKEVSLAPEEEARESYQWWETKDDANSSWYTAVKEWSYWDKFTVPGYQLRSGFNTYEGWYRDSDHQGSVVITHDQGKNGSDPMIGSGDAIFRVSPDKLPAGPAGGTMAETDSGLEAPDGAVTLWMCYTPIYIDVTAPIGVFLAENDAYVVGSDKRTDLETAAKFTVKGGTHDLVLTGVTATDVVSGEVGAGETKDGITTYPVANLAVKGDETAGGKPGLCEQMFKVYNPSEHGDTRFGKLGSRIFWVSPKGTVTPEGATHDQMTGTKDTGSRRYFGFASGIDNTLADNQKDEGDALDGFKLKKDATAADAKGGLDVIGTETASDGSVLSKTYRFYYGLDLRKTDFNLGAIQAMVEGDDAWQYNTAYKKPLVKVMFTFAVEQVPMVAYSARFGETVDGGAGVRDNGGESVTEEIVVG